MTQHTLHGRSEADLLWFQRRSFLQSAAAWTAAGGFASAHAQQRSNVVELLGDVLLNGQRMRPQSTVQTGDTVETGPASSLIFVIGDASFQVRQNSRLVVERGSTLNAVSVLRVLTGAVASVWGRGGSRQIVTPTVTAGIRGTGVYVEVFPQQAHRSYLCNCWGVVDVAAGTQRLVSRAEYHQSFWAEPQGAGNRLLTPTQAINYTDEEMEYLARLVDQRTAWQIAGRRGSGGDGYPTPNAPTPHPSARPNR
jgi:hypothetical protein